MDEAKYFGIWKASCWQMLEILKFFLSDSATRSSSADQQKSLQECQGDFSQVHHFLGSIFTMEYVKSTKIKFAGVSPPSFFYQMPRVFGAYSWNTSLSVVYLIALLQIRLGYFLCPPALEPRKLSRWWGVIHPEADHFSPSWLSLDDRLSFSWLEQPGGVGQQG